MVRVGGIVCAIAGIMVKVDGIVRISTIAGMMVRVDGMVRMSTIRRGRC